MINYLCRKENPTLQKTLTKANNILTRCIVSEQIGAYLFVSIKYIDRIGTSKNPIVWFEQVTAIFDRDLELRFNHRKKDFIKNLIMQNADHISPHFGRLEPGSHVVSD